jgi:hypothetical protein
VIDVDIQLAAAIIKQDAGIVEVIDQLRECLELSQHLVIAGGMEPGKFPVSPVLLRGFAGEQREDFFLVGGHQPGVEARDRPIAVPADGDLPAGGFPILLFQSRESVQEIAAENGECAVSVRPDTVLPRLRLGLGGKRRQPVVLPAHIREAEQRRT